jgi:hypothetical protein
VRARHTPLCGAEFAHFSFSSSLSPLMKLMERDARSKKSGSAKQNLVNFEPPKPTIIQTRRAAPRGHHPRVKQQKQEKNVQKENIIFHFGVPFAQRDVDSKHQFLRQILQDDSPAIAATNLSQLPSLTL